LAGGEQASRSEQGGDGSVNQRGSSPTTIQERQCGHAHGVSSVD
jgi:hypothetical protein